MDKWQPIETSPEDDQVVWLFEPHDMGGFMFAGWKRCDGSWGNNLDGETQHPTHWQPLPAPPAGDHLMTTELEVAIKQAREMVDAMTPKQHKAMIDAQRESFIRAMAPCEHGVFDFEQCRECWA